MQIPFLDPWQHATQLEFTFKFPAVRLHTVFFFFPFASLISTVHLSLEGMEKKEGISINEEIDPFAEKDFTWMIWFTIQRKMKFS